MLLYVTKVKLTGQPSCWNIQLGLFNLQKEIDFPSKLQKNLPPFAGHIPKTDFMFNTLNLHNILGVFQGGIQPIKINSPLIHP